MSLKSFDSRLRQKAGLLIPVVTMFTVIFAGAKILSAHAILTRSQPASNASVKGPSFPVELTFNSRVDQMRSTLTLEGPGPSKRQLAIRKSDAMPQQLISAVTDATPGLFHLRWQVLSIDGHITRGQINFEVR